MGFEALQPNKDNSRQEIPPSGPAKNEVDSVADDGFDSADKHPTDDRYYFREVFGEMEPAFISLVEQLKEPIEEGKYRVLVSDDIGGRIVTLALYEILKHRFEQGLKSDKSENKETKKTSQGRFLFQEAGPGMLIPGFTKIIRKKWTKYLRK